MSDIITLKSTVSTQVSRAIQIPSYFKNKFGSYYAIVSKDMGISIYPDKEYPTTCITRPENLFQYCNLNEPVDECEFWLLYNETKEAEQRLVTPHNPQP